jgi:hypothetical protein
MAAATPDDSVCEQRAHRTCCVAAGALTLAWFFIFDHFRPDYLVDEPGHLGNIYHFLEGKPGWPGQMTMLPGYHFTVAALWQLHPPLKLLTLARLVTTVTALLALFAFARAWTRLHGRPAGPAVLLLALLPIVQPFTGLAYTDVPGLAFTLLAVGAHLAGYRATGALLFGAAVCLRQTNVIWAGFLVAYEFLRPDVPRREFFQRTRGLLLFLLVCAVAIAAALVSAGRLTPGAQTGNDLRFNPASLHFAGLLTLFLGLPIWLTAAPAALGGFIGALRSRPAFTLCLTAVALTAAAALAHTFANPHAWNRDLFWDGCSFTLLRNWPLVWLDTHPWLRAASGLNVVLMALALAVAFARQPHRRELWLALATGALLPLTNGLVEPRYFIPVAVFVLLFLDLAPATVRRLTWWWLLLCASHAPFIAAGRSLW